MFLNPGSEVEDIVALRAVDYAVVQLTMEGKFDAKIKQYKVLKEQLDAKQQIADTLEMAEKIKSDAQSKADEVAAKAIALVAREAGLIAKEIALADKETEIVSRETAALRLSDEMTLKGQQMDEAARHAEDAITAREVSMRHQLDQLAIDRAVLESQKKEFNAKLEALRT